MLRHVKIQELRVCEARARGNDEARNGRNRKESPSSRVSRPSYHTSSSQKYPPKISVLEFINVFLSFHQCLTIATLSLAHTNGSTTGRGHSSRIILFSIGSPSVMTPSFMNNFHRGTQCLHRIRAPDWLVKILTICFLRGPSKGH